MVVVTVSEGFGGCDCVRGVRMLSGCISGFWAPADGPDSSMSHSIKLVGDVVVVVGSWGFEVGGCDMTWNPIL